MPVPTSLDAYALTTASWVTLTTVAFPISLVTAKERLRNSSASRTSRSRRRWTRCATSYGLISATQGRSRVRDADETTEPSSVVGRRGPVDRRRGLFFPNGAGHATAPGNYNVSMKQIWTGSAAQIVGKYGDNAPTAAVCCNACRTCFATNLLAIAAAGAGA